MKQQIINCQKNLLWKLLWFFPLLAIGCAAPQPQYKVGNKFLLAEQTQASQTNGGITVKLEPLDLAGEYKKSLYTQKFQILHVPFLADKAVLEEIELNVDNYYTKTIPFNVTIINDTDHILRMSDSRIIYIDPDNDEPVMALDKSTIMSNVEALPAFAELKDHFKKYSPLNDTTGTITAGLNNITNKINFVNGFNREVMPKMKMTGIVFFNVAPDKAAEGKISFVDMVSEVDPAGVPKKKVRFDYRIKSIPQYFRYRPGVDQAWQEISKDEYQVLPQDK